MARAKSVTVKKSGKKLAVKPAAKPFQPKTTKQRYV